MNHEILVKWYYCFLWIQLIWECPLSETKNTCLYLYVASSENDFYTRRKVYGSYLSARHLDSLYWEFYHTIYEKYLLVTVVVILLVLGLHKMQLWHSMVLMVIGKTCYVFGLKMSSYLNSCYYMVSRHTRVEDIMLIAGQSSESSVKDMRFRQCKNAGVFFLLFYSVS